MNLHKTLATVSGMTMLSRITGLAREILFARAFGASAYTDAFNVAFRIPNLLRRLFAEGAFSQAFVPILAEYKNQKGEAATKNLVDHVATVLIWVMLATTLIGILATPVIVYFIATGLKYNQSAFDAGVVMTRIMFPYIGFMAFVALAGGILNTWREFKIPAFTSVMLNVSFIIASLFVAPYLQQPIYAMAFAVFVGGILQVMLQIPALIKIGMLPRLYWNPMIGLQDEGVRRVLKKMGPAVFAVSAAQISLMINTNIASRLAHGSVSWLSYADRLMEFPTALLGVALGTILLPSLSNAHAENDMEEYSALLDWGLRLTFLLALPCAVGLATLSEPLTATLFHYGKFDSVSVAMTAHALVAYGVGLIGLILVKILAPGFYAKQDIRTPVKIAIGVLIATQLMNYLFVPWIAHAGLALSIGLGACLNASFLFWGLRRRNIYVPRPGWGMFLAKLAGALILLALAAIIISHRFDWIGLRAHPGLRVGALLLVLCACAIAYFGSLMAMGFRLRDFKRISR
ncbi:putative peptidoglycan lipid II flippase [Herbaspirillum sp. Sphag1AN]|uniref:murein biosynthesis integral membrane protein MurJ n=1 Tax=unclassified Herbaspirillum TaxID=2624150 RepID=UPI00161715AE|nr:MULTISPECIES: murein biosynthesis integral membrane protein MurJ [unclassified Herbaspirillum]MBB3211187.1 putative peptidoglycan lipid II flippase [Herbaspirillum sp. Sphag1AN]MBB3244816.1 putative peptidoglycan lipid II flippase [Herbaspirillum sp. Sphag64]